jgi:membrane protein implicated in regulation of membrane protease activity
MVGRQVRCVEAIDGDQTTGVVLVDGARWSASTEPGQAIEAGAQVVITAVEGARVRVRPAATQPR